MKQKFDTYEEMFTELKAHYDLMQMYDVTTGKNTVTVFHKGKRDAASIVAAYDGNHLLGYTKIDTDSTGSTN